MGIRAASGEPSLSATELKCVHRINQLNSVELKLSSNVRSVADLGLAWASRFCHVFSSLNRMRSAKLAKDSSRKLFRYRADDDPKIQLQFV